MSAYDILLSAVVSAVVSAVTAFIVVKLQTQAPSRNGPVEHRKLIDPAQFRKKASETLHQFSKQSAKPAKQDKQGKEIQKKQKEPEGNSEHNAVLRKVASDMKSQLKGFQDFVSRDPQPIKIPEISHMPLWKDLVDNHLPKDFADFIGKWHTYLDELRKHSELEAQMFVDIESGIRKALHPYNFLQNRTLTDIPPEKTIYYSVEFMGNILSNWLSSIRKEEPKYTSNNDFLISSIDAKRALKESGYRFLILGNNRVACGPVDIIEDVQEKFREFLIGYQETELFSKYTEMLGSSEDNITALGNSLREMLNTLESAESFRGKCRYIR